MAVIGPWLAGWLEVRMSPSVSARGVRCRLMGPTKPGLWLAGSRACWRQVRPSDAGSGDQMRGTPRHRGTVHRCDASVSTWHDFLHGFRVGFTTRFYGDVDSTRLQRLGVFRGRGLQADP